MDCTRRTCWLQSTQEMWSVARNTGDVECCTQHGEFIGNKVTRDHVCVWDTWQPWRLLEVSVTVICERICPLWFGIDRPSHVLRCFHWSILFFIHGVRESCETDVHPTWLQTLLAIGSTTYQFKFCITVLKSS